MSGYPAPSTAKYIPAATPITEPHGESHDAEGNDPILPTIRYVDLAVLTGYTAVTSVATYVPITDLDIDFKSRGGQIFVIVSGHIRLISSVADIARAVMSIEVDGVVGTYISNFELQAENNSSLGQLAIDLPATTTWLVPMDAGSHNINLQAFVRDSASNTLEFYAGTSIVLLELFPKRRA